MKYLKVYKLFESNELDIPDHIKHEINDISYDITDEGYIVSWSNNTINITKGNKSAYSDIKEFCDRIIDYLDLEGYQGLVKFKGIGSDDNFYPIDRSLVTWGPFKDYHMCVSRYYKIEVHKKEDINESNWEPLNLAKNLISSSNHYLDLSESIKVLHDICYELKDEGVEYYIQPDNEVKVRMLSLVLNDKIEPRKLDFHLEIHTTGKLTDKVKRSGMFSAPDWFIEILKRVEDYVSTLGFSVKCLVYHPYGWKPLNSIEELSQVSGIVRAVKLQFKNDKILENRNH